MTRKGAERSPFFNPCPNSGVIRPLGNTMKKTTFETIMVNTGMVECVYCGETMYRGAVTIQTGPRDGKIEKTAVMVFARDMGDGWYRASFTRDTERWELKEGEMTRTVIGHIFLPLYLLQGFLTNPISEYDALACEAVEFSFPEDRDLNHLSQVGDDLLKIEPHVLTEIGEPFPQTACTVSFVFSKEVRHFNPSDLMLFIVDYCKDKMPLERSSIEKHWEQVFDTLSTGSDTIEIYCPVNGKYTWAKISSASKWWNIELTWREYIRTDKVRGVRVSSETYDPICVCGVAKSEHALCGCECFEARQETK